MKKSARTIPNRPRRLSNLVLPTSEQLRRNSARKRFCGKPDDLGKRLQINSREVPNRFDCCRLGLLRMELSQGTVGIGGASKKLSITAELEH